MLTHGNLVGPKSAVLVVRRTSVAHSRSRAPRLPSADRGRTSPEGIRARGDRGARVRGSSSLTRHRYEVFPPSGIRRSLARRAAAHHIEAARSRSVDQMVGPTSNAETLRPRRAITRRSYARELASSPRIRPSKARFTPDATNRARARSDARSSARVVLLHASNVERSGGFAAHACASRPDHLRAVGTIAA